MDPANYAKELQLKNQDKKPTVRILRKKEWLPPPKIMRSWPDNILICPNTFLRCALFGVVAKGKRQQLDKSSVNAQGGITLSVSGAELDQDDCDVWLSLLYLARGMSADKKIVTSANELVRLTGRVPSNANRKVLGERLRRLCRVSIEIAETRGMQYSGHLVLKVLGGSELDAYEITLPPQLFGLFDDGRYTSLQISHRSRLKSHLARWLHGYFTSHNDPIPMKIETIHDLCGSTSKSTASFEAHLRSAMRTVAKETGGKYQIRKGKLYWCKGKRDPVPGS